MLRAIQRFYSEFLSPPEAAEGVTSRPATDRALQLATAALLIEASQADYQVTDRERGAVTQALKGAFGLTDAETDHLVALAEQEARDATSLYQFTHLIDKGFSRERKREVVALLWDVVFADRRMEPHEEALVRRVADLIHVPHKDFIDTKLEARDAARDAAREDDGPPDP